MPKNKFLFFNKLIQTVYFVDFSKLKTFAFDFCFDPTTQKILFIQTSVPKISLNQPQRSTGNLTKQCCISASSVPYSGANAPNTGCCGRQLEIDNYRLFHRRQPISYLPLKNCKPWFLLKTTVSINTTIKFLRRKSVL